MESVMISIKPKWCELIASGKKTVEVRKTRPKCETPFKCYIYETKHSKYVGCGCYELCGGKVIGEFVCDKVEESIYDPFKCGQNFYDIEWDKEDDCLTDEEFEQYFNKKDGFGWHISDLKIYDEPKELSEFRHCGANYHYNPAISRPPQSWCYCEEPTDDLDEWELDPCYECTGYGDDYSYDEELDDLVSNCTNCPFFGRDD